MARERADAYVWVWLPGAVEPVPAGALTADRGRVLFNYGRAYLQRPDAIPLCLPELPLRQGLIDPPAGMTVAGSLRDAGPDSWGQRVILSRLTGVRGRTADTGDLPVLTCFLESGSDRVGALDFQVSPMEHRPRTTSATLPELVDATDRFLAGEPISDPLAQAFVEGTSIGGARPKVLISGATSDGRPRESIAKLSVSGDPYPVVRAEMAAMTLAQRAGIEVARVEHLTCMGKDVLLVDRFDRPGTAGSVSGRLGERRLVISALTILGLDEMYGRHATYWELADHIRSRFTRPRETLRELFTRIVFNVCISNTDDHVRNHAAFWDGQALTLTPAYDLSPQLRSGDTAAQAMAIGPDGSRASRLAVCVDACRTYQLERHEAKDICESVVDRIRKAWPEAADAARLTTNDRELLWERLILHPSIHLAE